MTVFTFIWAAYAVLLVAIVVFAAWVMWAAPRRRRREVDALEAAWALEHDEAVRR